MRKRMNPSALGTTPTRRQMIAGLGIALGGLAAGSELWGKPQPQAMKAAGSPAANETRTSLHQEVAFTVPPQRIYEVLLDSKQFAAVTGLPAEIDPKAGGAFTTFGGLILGRNVELIPSQRIVQAWRPAAWPSGVYSIVKFELKPQASGVLVVLDHTGFPESDFDGLTSGWPERYWEPLKKYFA
jgi:activator of HSP90 ATPase